MCNFFVFEAVSMKLWVGYAFFMELLELFLAVFVDRSFSRYLLKVYVSLAVFLEFPYAMVSLVRGQGETIYFIPWVSSWHGSLLLHLREQDTQNTS